jgi:UDP-glucose 4-epimerase
MRKVLVTGGLGFIGSNLVDLVMSTGDHEVTVIDNLISDSSSENYRRPDVTYWIEDIRTINEKRGGEKFDVVFHLAALARIQPSFKKPLETISIDSYGTAEVCEFARQSGAKVVYAGSSSFYGGPYLNPYAFAKWHGEEICQLYAKCFGVSTAIARFFNVYGPRQPEMGDYATVVGIFEKKHRENEPLSITGDGEQRRDFTHVGDICAGLLAISKHEFVGDVFNLGTGTNHSINELAAMFGGTAEYIPGRPGEARNTLADISKTTEMTTWTPQVKLEEYILNFIGG